MKISFSKMTLGLPFFFVIGCNFSTGSSNNSISQPTPTPPTNVDTPEILIKPIIQSGNTSELSGNKSKFRCAETDYNIWKLVAENSDGSWKWVINKSEPKQDCETIANQANQTDGYFCEQNKLYNAYVGDRKDPEQIGMGWDSFANPGSSCEVALDLLTRFQGWMGVTEVGLINSNMRYAGLVRRNSKGFNERHVFKNAHMYGLNEWDHSSNDAKIKDDLVANASHGYFCLDNTYSGYATLWKINNKVRELNPHQNAVIYWIGGREFFQNKTQCEEAIESILKNKGRYCETKNPGWMIDTSLDAWLEPHGGNNVDYSKYPPEYGTNFGTAENCRQNL